jgi:hypothetical protein
MGDEDKPLEGLKSLYFGTLGADKFKPITFVKDSVFISEDTEPITKPQKGLSFDCSLPISEVAAIPTLRELFGLPEPKLYSEVCIRFPPKTKRKVNYHLYWQRWSKATSLRKAKKYCKILGSEQTKNGRYHFANVNFAVMFIPNCEISTYFEIDRNRAAHTIIVTPKKNCYED